MTVRGVDVSHHQKPIDWPRARAAGIRFAYVKATEGARFRDPAYTAHVRGAAAAGLLVGPYHFARLTGDPRVQAAHFARVVGDMAGLLPPMLDVEHLPGYDGRPNPNRFHPARTPAWCAAFLDELQARTGRRGGLYTGVGYWTAPAPELADVPLWVASWTSRTRPTMPPGWTSWTFWQHDVAKVDGAQGRVDVNRYAGTLAQLLHLTDLRKDPVASRTLTPADVAAVGTELIRRLGADPNHPYTGAYIVRRLAEIEAKLDEIAQRPLAGGLDLATLLDHVADLVRGTA